METVAKQHDVSCLMGAMALQFSQDLTEIATTGTIRNNPCHGRMKYIIIN